MSLRVLFKSIVVFVSMFLFAGGAVGEVIGWWRASDEAGVVTNTLGNAALTGTLVPYTNGASNTITENGVAFTKTGIDGFRTFDPVTQQMMSDDAFFVEGTGTGRGGGYLEIPDHASLHAQSFTFELFYKWDARATPGSGNWHLVAAKQLKLGYDSWSILFTGPNKLQGRFTDANGGKIWTDPKTDLNLMDGRWHHIALTVDGVKQVATIYVDYEVALTKTLGFALTYNDQPLFVGGFPTTPNAHRGWFSDVRLTEQVLDVNDFLGFRDVRADEDTFFWQRFGDNGFFGFETPKNKWGTPSLYHFCHTGTNDSGWVMENYRTGEDTFAAPVSDVTNRFSSMVYAGLNDAAGLANGGSHQFKKTGSGCVGVSDKNLSVISGDFTAECIFSVTNKCEWIPLIRQRNPNNVAFNLGFSGNAFTNKLSVTFTSENAEWASQRISEWMYNDGKWHHAAVIYRKEGYIAELWIDYELETRWDVTFPAWSTNSSSAFMAIGIGGAPGVKAANFFPGKMDEVRVTRRALSREEFITNRHVPRPEGDGATLAHWRFEDGMLNAETEGYADVQPLPCWGAETAPTLTNLVRGIYLNTRDHSWRPNLDNAGSLACLSGKSGLYYPWMPILERDAFTVECYVNTTDQRDWIPLLWYNVDIASRIPVWAISLHQGKIWLRMDLQGTENGKHVSALVADGTWHHLAVTFESGTGRSVATLYVDGVRSDSLEAEGNFAWTTDGNFMIGCNNTANYYQGFLDEIRISSGILTPSKFLELYNRQGTMILLR